MWAQRHPRQPLSTGDRRHGEGCRWPYKPGTEELVKSSKVCFRRMKKHSGCSCVSITCSSALSAFFPMQKGTAARIPFARFLKSRLPLAGKTQALQQPRGCLLCVYGFRANNTLNYKIKLSLKVKPSITHRVHPRSYRRCRRRAHSNSLGASSPSPAAKPGELEEASPLSWALPASSPCCQLKICWLKSLLEGWFSIFSERKTFFLATEAGCRHTHTGTRSSSAEGRWLVKLF